jgi:hypothetical protein
MHTIINGDGFIIEEGLGMQGMTQGYAIDVEPLFDQYGQPIGQDTDVDVEADDQDLGDAKGRDPHKKMSQRTLSYTNKEDQCLSKSWVSISQDPIYRILGFVCNGPG